MTINIFDFIPSAQHAAIIAGTSSYDVHADLMMAIASYGGPNKSTDAIDFPPGGYWYSQTIDLKRIVKFLGTGSGMQGGATTLFHFPEGMPGIIVERHNTLAGGLESPSTGYADGTVIEGISLVGHKTSNVLNQAHGIILRARAQLRNFSASSFGGNGVHIVADCGGLPDREGNANNFSFDVGSVTSNNGHGVFVDGSCANAGIVTLVDASNNGGVGFYDSSFLGNTFIACHADANAGGPYKTDAIAARTLLLNCYSESGQPPAMLESNTFVLGGQHAAGFDLASKHAEAIPVGGGTGGIGMGTLASSRMTADGQAFYSVQVNPDPNSATLLSIIRILTGQVAPQPWLLKFLAPALHEDLVLAYGHLSDHRVMRLTGEHTNFAQHGGSGRPSPAKYVAAFARVGLTTNIVGNDGLVLTAGGSAAPTSGEYGRGDRIYNIFPSPGGPEGWVCTTGGTAGVDAVFNTFGTISA